MKNLNSNKLTAGLCDTCKNCVTATDGNGIDEPFETHPFCKKKLFIIEPALALDKENQVLECEDYQKT